MYQVTLQSAEKDPDTLAEIYLALGAMSVCVQDNSLCILASKASWFKQVGLTQKPTRLKKSDWEYQHELCTDTQTLIPGVLIQSAHTKTHSKQNALETIILDLRGAFGDGAHPTTRLCAHFLSEIVTQENPQSLIDIGTGTGVLAILASKYSIPTVHAFDYDPISVTRTKRNIRLNKTPIDVWQGDIHLEKSKQKYDIVIANLQTHLIESNLTQLKQYLNPQGCLIVSGVSIQWKNEMELRFQKENLMLIESRIQKDWCGFILKAQGHPQ